MPKLADLECSADPAGTGLLSLHDQQELAREVAEWRSLGRSLEREFVFRGFDEAMAFVNRVAGLAKTQNHHPDIWISFRKVRLTLSTHSSGGLTRNDFILAAKIDRLLQEAQ